MKYLLNFSRLGFGLLIFGVSAFAQPVVISKVEVIPTDPFILRVTGDGSGSLGVECDPETYGCSCRVNYKNSIVLGSWSKPLNVTSNTLDCRLSIIKKVKNGIVSIQNLNDNTESNSLEFLIEDELKSEVIW